MFISWSEPNPPHGIILHYYIKIIESGKETIIKDYNSTSISWDTWTNKWKITTSENVKIQVSIAFVKFQNSLLCLPRQCGKFLPTQCGGIIRHHQTYIILIKHADILISNGVLYQLYIVYITFPCFVVKFYNLKKENPLQIQAETSKGRGEFSEEIDVFPPTASEFRAIFVMYQKTFLYL